MPTGFESFRVQEPNHDADRGVFRVTESGLQDVTEWDIGHAGAGKLQRRIGGRGRDAYASRDDVRHFRNGNQPSGKSKVGQGIRRIMHKGAD